MKALTPKALSIGTWITLAAAVTPQSGLEEAQFFTDPVFGSTPGDSLGQVASQTLHNLGAIGPDVTLPVLRPLIGMDKMEITDWSRKIGAFETSILPYRDCCSIRSPKPILTAKPREILEFDGQMDLDGAVREAAKACGGNPRRALSLWTRPPRLADPGRPARLLRPRGRSHAPPAPNRSERHRRRHHSAPAPPSCGHPYGFSVSRSTRAIWDT